jgi:transposase
VLACLLFHHNHTYSTTFFTPVTKQSRNTDLSLRTSTLFVEMPAPAKALKRGFKVFEDLSDDELLGTPGGNGRNRRVQRNPTATSTRIPKPMGSVNTNKRKPRRNPTPEHTVADARRSADDDVENIAAGGYKGADADDQMASDGRCNHTVEKGGAQHCGGGDRSVEMGGVVSGTSVNMSVAAGGMAIDGGGECEELEKSPALDDDDQQSCRASTVDVREVEKRAPSKEIEGGDEIRGMFTPAHFDKLQRLLKAKLPWVYLYDRKKVNGCLYREETDCHWRDVPGFASKTQSTGLARAFRKMTDNGSWRHIQRYRKTSYSLEIDIDLEKFDDEELAALAQLVADEQAARIKVGQD